ncbi:MAG: DUF6851 domain-containing protein, partial [Planctomycetota bacterium]
MKAPLLSVSAGLTIFVACVGLRPSGTAEEMVESGYTPTAAYRWLDAVLDAAARDVERVGAMPTILSRQMAIPMTAMFDAWAAYDDLAVGTTYGGGLRRPPAERTRSNQEEAMAYAVFRTAVDQLPHFAADLEAVMRVEGYDPALVTRDPTRPAGIGHLVADAILAARHGDGANQLGDEPGGAAEPYADYTMYRPVNPPDRIHDPDRWQPIPFDDGAGGQVVLGFLTPHWYRVRPFALDSADQFRPG